MKKTFIYLSAVLALAGCAKNEVSEDALAPVNSDIIGFNTSTRFTRAADNTTADALKTGFNVIGIDAKGAILFTKPTDATVGSKFWFETTKWKWEKETADKKWPTNGTLYPIQFIAAYPLLADAEMGPWVAGAANYTKAIAIDENDFAANVDLMAAKAEVVNKPTTGTTPLTFKHILSKIAFQIVSPENYKIYIQSVTIRQVAKSGHTYNYKDGSYDAETIPYTATANYNHVGITMGAPAALTGLGDAINKGVVINSNATAETWKLMPQGLTPAWNKAAFTTAAASFTGSDADWTAFMGTNPTILNNAMIEVVYRMEDAAGKSIVGWHTDEDMGAGKIADKNYSVKVAYVLDLSKQANKDVATMGWLPAYSYTYQIKFGTPDATNGTVIDPNYKGDDGGNTDKPIDNPATKPGDDITKTDSYIDFNVIVDEWIDNNTQIK